MAEPLPPGAVDQSAPPLPEFASPPVVEVSLSLQFDGLPRLNVGHAGVYWTRIRERFPHVQQQPALPPAIERFDVLEGAQPTFSFGIMQSTGMPRCWFMSAAGDELIQLQSDRFVFNWRRSADAMMYPRFPAVRDRFGELFGQFGDLMGGEGLGSIVPNQCEVTYTNHIVAGEVWADHGELGRVIAPWSGKYSDTFLQEPEDVQVQQRSIIKGADGLPLGRLYIAVQPAIRPADSVPIYVLTLTARGAPLPETEGGASGFFELGHEHVVRGFAAFTTERMHKAWKRLR
jgi:uncharacterized protein (TIGR04255 family)